MYRYGVYTWLDGSVYAGQFYEDHFQGYGYGLVYDVCIEMCIDTCGGPVTNSL